MFNEGAPEFIVDQGMYYPTATNYGYFCTGFESPGDWDDHHRVFGLDGHDVQYVGGQTENSPFVYYTPSYGYAQSPYNPYNPYIPGAIIGIDSPFVGAQQYYTFPSYENPSPSSSYLPMAVQSRSEIIANNTTDPFIDTTASTANRADGPGLKHHLSSASPAFPSTVKGPTSSRTSTSSRMTEGNQGGAGSNKRSLVQGNVTPGGFSNPSSLILQNGGAAGMENVLHGKALSSRGHLKVELPQNGGFSGFRPSTHVQTTADKVQQKMHYGRVLNETKVNSAPTEQNQVSKLDKSKVQFSVKAYTTRAGVVDGQGNITIYLDQYNKDGFPVDYLNAKFFVIKSYSEDDVHKSIKYNVWSSTPNGNKKLNIAYEDARKLANGDSDSCPIFLFFSVNASGQFCGVAEMTGPVDFHKDMDFWQQDKWNGSFPVKWHIIKDVPNPNFRHIILENNDNKPVTNSRDTQEIRYKKGIEMLKIFKGYSSKTSLLDDFMYYENRQKMLQEEKTRLLVNNYDNRLLVPVLDPPRKLSAMVSISAKEDDKVIKKKDSVGSDKNEAAPGETTSLDGNTSSNLTRSAEHNNSILSNGEESIGEALKIGSLTITTKQSSSVTEPQEAGTRVSASNTGTSEVLTVGTVPVNVNGFAETSGFLTVGTIPLDPRAFK